MGALNFLRGFVLPNVGLKGSSGSTAGTLNARLAALIPYVNGTTGTVLTYPSSVAAPSAFAPDATWGTTGTYTTILSSGTLSSHMLTGVYMSRFDFQRYEINIASGAAGAEVIQHSVRPPQLPSNLMIFPPVQWPTNERVSFRVAGDTTSVSISVITTFAQRPA